MKILLSSWFFIVGTWFADPGAVLQKMHKAYAGKWHKTVTFTQTTQRYRNDTLTNTTIWKEAMQFPDKLRIDLGPKEKGNTVIYTADSTYNFRNGKKLRTSTVGNDLIYLLGGMFFHPLDAVKQQLTAMGFNLNRSFETTFDGRKVTVIGATAESETTNQLWIDNDRLILLRMIKFEKGNKEDAVFKEHKKLTNSWIETKVLFYINGQLLQTEEYLDIHENAPLDPKIFEPKYYGTVSWY